MQKIRLKSKKKKIVIAHSPDADDAFMFYSLANGVFKNDNFEVNHVLKDIQTLNKESESLLYDVQAISFFAYPDVVDKYQLLSCGGSVGYGYGPLLVGNEKVERDLLSKLKGATIAVPGEKTTAYLLLKLLIKDFKSVVLPFDQILDAVSKGEYPFGLIIHEGQLSYLKHGLNKIVDLGQWWLGLTNLPVPLGGNVIKRAYAESDKKDINLLIKNSILYALENKEKVARAVSGYAREIEHDENLISKFVSMYVNDFTVDYGISGKLAIKKLYQMAYENDLIKNIPVLDFVE